MERTRYQKVLFLRTVYDIFLGDEIKEIEERMNKCLTHDRFEDAMSMRAALNLTEKLGENGTFDYLEEMKDVITELGEEHGLACMDKDIDKYNYYYEFKHK